MLFRILKVQLMGTLNILNYDVPFVIPSGIVRNVKVN
jgi:hypothetical protein